jgi:hypothetical protein
MGVADEMMLPNGMPLIESVHALEETKERIKPYARRKAKTEAHWRRMDKKWRKRYGFVMKPAIFILGGNTIVAHPTLAAKIRAEVRAQFNDPERETFSFSIGRYPLAEPICGFYGSSI